MTSTRSALDADWLGGLPARGGGPRAHARGGPDHRGAGARDRHPGQRRRPHARDRPDARSSSCSTSSTACATRDTGSCAVSEERGEIDYGDHDVRVIIDPIDGSLNAKRGVPSYALSIAVADGDTMADVAFGFVHDFGPSEAVVGVAGPGRLAGRRPARSDASRAPRTRRPARGAGHRVRRSALDRGLDRRPPGQRLPPARARHDRRIAVPGGRGARFDGMVSLRRSRGVDAAAGQLIVREAGGCGQLPLVR